MKDTYVDGEKLARNGRKMATYYAASFLPHYRRVLFSHLLVFNLCTKATRADQSKGAVHKLCRLGRGDGRYAT